MKVVFYIVTPAEAGVQWYEPWIPVCTGMTILHGSPLLRVHVPYLRSYQPGMDFINFSAQLAFLPHL
jgi:hypothetical protein